MIKRVWTIGVKVTDLQKELDFHAALGSRMVLDETIEHNQQHYRIPLLALGDKYLHLSERMIYEASCGLDLPHGLVHIVYVSDSFTEDVNRAAAAGAALLGDPAEISAGFGRRRVAFLRSPGGMIFEIIEIIEDRVAPV